MVPAAPSTVPRQGYTRATPWLLSLVLVLLFAQPSSASPPVPYAPSWPLFGQPVFVDSSITSGQQDRSSYYGSVDDGAGGAYVAAQSGPNTSQFRLQRLDATGGRHTAWPPGGLTLIPGGSYLVHRITLHRDQAGGLLVAISGYFPDLPLLPNRTQVWRVREQPAPTIEWSRLELFTSSVIDPWFVFERDGHWTQVWCAEIPSGPRALLARRFGPDGLPAPGWPAEGMVLDSSTCSPSACRVIDERLPLPRLLSDGSIGIVFEAYTPGAFQQTARVNFLRLSPQGQVLDRGSEPHLPKVTAIRAWAPDASDRPMVVLSDSGLVQLLLMESWHGGVLRRETLRPDSGGAVFGGRSLGVRLASDRNGGAWTAFLGMPGPGGAVPKLVLMHHLFSQPPVSLEFGPPPGALWFSSLVFAASLSSDAAGNAVLVTGATPDEEQFEVGFTSTPGRLQVVSASGELPPGDSLGVEIPSESRANFAPNGDVLISRTSNQWPSNAFSVIAQRMHADQPVATLAPRVSGGRVGGSVELTWQLSGDAATVALIERSIDDAPFDVFATLAPDGEGRVRVRDTEAPSVAHLRYRLSVAGLVLDTWDLAAQVQSGLSLSLRCGADAVVSAAVTLEGLGDARLDVFDVAGRLQRSQNLGDRGAGVHEVLLPIPGPPGLWLVRLREGASQRVVRYASVR